MKTTKEYIAAIKKIRTKANLVKILEEVKDWNYLTDFSRDNLNQLCRDVKHDINWDTREVSLEVAKKRAVSNIY